MKKVKQKLNFIKKGTTVNTVINVKYLLLLLVLLSSAGTDKKKILIDKMDFKIVNKTSQIGYITIERSIKENKTTYTLKSEVKPRMFLKFNVTCKEKSVYRGDTMIFSSIYRKINKKIKLNHSVFYFKGSYFLNNSKENSPLNLEVVNWSLSKLFFNEPVGVTSVYCDKLKKMLLVKCIAPHTYKVFFSNKSYNIYHYSQGRCILVDATGTFFKVKLIASIEWDKFKENNI